MTEYNCPECNKRIYTTSSSWCAHDYGEYRVFYLSSLTEIRKKARYGVGRDLYYYPLELKCAAGKKLNIESIERLLLLT